MTNESRAEVVVGVDGSADSDRALRWAAEYVRRGGGHLTVLTAWQWPTTYGTAVLWDGWDPAVDAQQVVEKAAAELTLPADAVETRVVCGPAAETLVRASASADLLVVGTRGHGSIAGALLGSVSSHCVHHAHCPVLVVR